MTYTPRLKISAGGTNRTSFDNGGGIVYRARQDDFPVGPTLTSSSSLIFNDTVFGYTVRLIVGTGALPPEALVGLEVTTGDAVINGVTVGRGASGIATNTVFGASAGTTMGVGERNVCIGTDAQAGTTSSGSNVVIGSAAGTTMGVGERNVCIGTGAQVGTSSVGQNTTVGASAGSTIGSGTNNVCIGYNAEPTGSGTSNEITLGNSSMTRFRIGATAASAPNPGFAINTLSTQPTMNVGHDANTSNAPFASFFIAGANSGGIRQAAGGGTPLVYATSSDYRIKTDVQAIEAPLDRLAALKPCRFHFTTNPAGPLVEGFIAHEVQSVVPQAVVGTKDEVDADGNPVHQGLDQAHLVPLLTAVCQELHAKNQQLEARLAALEAAVAALQAG